MRWRRGQGRHNRPGSAGENSVVGLAGEPVCGGYGVVSSGTGLATDGGRGFCVAVGFRRARLVVCLVDGDTARGGVGAAATGALVDGVGGGGVWTGGGAGVGGGAHHGFESCYGKLGGDFGWGGIGAAVDQKEKWEVACSEI